MKDTEYTPNHIPAETRALHIVSSTALIAYGSYGLWRDDLYLPGRRGRGVHLHGLPAAIMFAAIVAASAVLIATVVDHYDRRDNERHYRTFAKYGEILGWSLFATSVFASIAEGLSH